jgi:hypothetical protein
MGIDAAEVEEFDFVIPIRYMPAEVPHSFAFFADEWVSLTLRLPNFCVPSFAKKVASYHTEHALLFCCQRFQKAVVEINAFVVGVDAEPLIPSVGANIVAINRNS